MSCFHPWAPLDFVVNPTLHTTVVWHTDQAVCHSSSAFKCGWITGGHRPWKAEYLNWPCLFVAPFLHRLFVAGRSSRLIARLTTVNFGGDMSGNNTGNVRWCHTGQLATPIRNGCFSHEFADMIHFWKTYNTLQHCKYRKKSSATGCYTRTIFRATSYHCKLTSVTSTLEYCGRPVSLSASTLHRKQLNTYRPLGDPNQHRYRLPGCILLGWTGTQFVAGCSWVSLPGCFRAPRTGRFGFWKQHLGWHK